MMRKSRKTHTRTVDFPLEFQGQIFSVAHDISESGMLCRTSRQLDEMTLLDIRFQLPRLDTTARAECWVECRGVVVRCEKKSGGSIEMPYEVAIFFDDISEENRMLLSGCMEKDDSLVTG